MEITELTKLPGFVRLECSEGRFIRRKGSDAITDNHSAVVPADAADDWEEVELAEARAAEETRERETRYKEDVVRRIRTRYSADDERALLRKMLAVAIPSPVTLAATEGEESDLNDTPPRDPEAVAAEFLEYDRFVERCKADAKTDALASQWTDSIGHTQPEHGEEGGAS